MYKVKNELTDYKSSKNIYAKEAFQRMDVHLDLSMRTSHVVPTPLLQSTLRVTLRQPP